MARCSGCETAPRAGGRPTACGRPSAPIRPTVPDLRGVVHQLVEAGGDEVVELHLADRPQPASAAPTQTPRTPLSAKRRVNDAVAELGQQRTEQQEGISVLASHVFAVHEYVGIRSKRVADADHDPLPKR
jgi:hypothetical protein